MPPEDLAPMLMGGLVFLIPIVAILTAHQRKMAELIHGRKQEGQEMPSLNSERMAMMERELLELKDLVRRQTIVLDDIRGAQQAAPASSEELPTRLSSQ